MTKKEKIEIIDSELKSLYPNPERFLIAGDEFQFLIAVILSAQAQDKVVNVYTPYLFSKYPNPLSLYKADYEDVLSIIAPIGLGQSKAKNIIALAKELVNKYDGKIVHDYKTLQSLPGVGSKTAAVFLGEIDHLPYIPVDTHISRIAYRLGLAGKKDSPLKTERMLEKYYKGDEHIEFHRRLILFGRNICLSSNKRKCEICPFNFCKERKQ